MSDTRPYSAYSKGQALLGAIRVLKAIEASGLPATTDERLALSQFPGFGQLALLVFPDPITSQYTAPRWQELGEALQALLTPDEYASAKRTVFTAFYTSPIVMRALYHALRHLGLPPTATILEPGCGSGGFLGLAPADMCFVAVELDSLSGRIARLRYPRQDIRIENFRDTRLVPESMDAVIGNPPFSDLKIDYWGDRLSLHEFFLAKSLDALKPGGVLAMVVTHYLLDRTNPAFRHMLADRAALLGAIRLPNIAFAEEGTRVIADLLFLQKRPLNTPLEARLQWDAIFTKPLMIEGVEVPVNQFFHRHPEMVLGRWTRANRLYGNEVGYSLEPTGDLAAQLVEAVQRFPCDVFCVTQDATPPPAIPRTPLTEAPPAHLQEGSFFVSATHAILQVQHGTAVPVLHSGTSLQATTGLMGRRLAHLIALRDAARAVLQSQHAGQPSHDKDRLRTFLGESYTQFITRYGPINKTTITTRTDGTVVRRMPNLVKFRDDPDGPLVMALEQYDEETNTAERAAIFTQDVVGHEALATTVQSAEEALLVSLDRTGRVDLPLMASLYGKDVRELCAELGELLYQDPVTQEWLTSDVYLSGNVRAKLVEALTAGAAYVRNLEALRAVQPEDILPGAIDANLGVPWIPAEDIKAFALHLFQAKSWALDVAHNRKEATWIIDSSRWARSSLAATTEYGTGRADGVWLLELALNLKVPTVYDAVLAEGKEQRVVNPQETLAARDKQQLIKERFKSWVFTDADRTERLVRVYNDTFNNIRLRRLDGSHLVFHGMSPHITLYPHQKDAAWRIMSSGNTLLAHAVGAGKTNVMMAAGMKMKQAGLIRKPMYVMPNHMLEQFVRECLQLYPNARLLMAGKEDFTQERRKLLTAKIATGQWDGILTTHSSFERIGMSRDVQAAFLQEQIAAYEDLLVERHGKDDNRAHRNIIKQLEKQKARYEARLEALMAEDKKDDGLVFDELGVDYLFIDESAYFKNLQTPTKMDYVAGIQTQGSQRAFDLLMKVRWLDQQHPGHGLTFATGTPISNSMVELYTLQRYLDPAGLESRSLAHFDAWAATFGEVVEVLEISPDGKTLRPRSRFAKFINLPELQQMFRQFADVQTADQLQLPRPTLAGEKATIVPCPMSEEQRRLQDLLVKRYERVRNGEVKPWEDNALAITTDGRKLALEGRMLLSAGSDWAASKVNALVARVACLWEDTAALRATQLLFADLGVHPTPWGYGVYADIIAKLVARGIPAHEIADIGAADTDAKKHVLFDKVRQGRVRILLGSTQKMGMGTNVQQRLIALHHLDAPWKPAEVEQREGRILRQGNMHPEVCIYRYVTQGSFDAFMWQALETKARFIAQVMTGASTARQADDIGDQELSYAEVKAIASGNPAVLTLAETDAELQRLYLLQKHHADAQFLARLRVKHLPDDIAKLETRFAALQADAATVHAHPEDTFTCQETPMDRESVLAYLETRMSLIPIRLPDRLWVPLGMHKGLTFGLSLAAYSTPEVSLKGQLTRSTPIDRRFREPRGVLHAVDHLVNGYASDCTQVLQELETQRRTLATYQARLVVDGSPPVYHTALLALRDELRLALATPEETAPGMATAIVARINALRAAHTVEPVPAHAAVQYVTSMEEAITTRIRQRLPQDVPALDTLATVDQTHIPTPWEPEVPPTLGPNRAAHQTLRQRVIARDRANQLALF